MNVIKVLKLIDLSTITLIIKKHKDRQCMDIANSSSHSYQKKSPIFPTENSCVWCCNVDLYINLKICIKTSEKMSKQI